MPGSLLSVVNLIAVTCELLTRPPVASVEKAALASISVSSASVWVSLASVGVSLGKSLASVYRDWL